MLGYLTGVFALFLNPAWFLLVLIGCLQTSMLNCNAVAIRNLSAVGFEQSITRKFKETLNCCYWKLPLCNLPPTFINQSLSPYMVDFLAHWAAYWTLVCLLTWTRTGLTLASAFSDAHFDSF